MARLAEASALGAADFKAHCLEVIERVRRTREPVVITKRGVPVAQLTPVPRPRPRDVLGCLAGSFTIAGDVVSPLHTPREWAEFEAAAGAALVAEPDPSRRRRRP